MESQNTDWSRLKTEISKFATSALARDQIRDLAPLPSEELALRACQEVLEASQLIAIGSRPSLESLDFVRLWLDRLKKQAVLKTTDLKDVRRFCIDSLTFQASISTLSPASNSWLHRSSVRLLDANRPLAAIDQLMTSEGDFRTDASDELYRLFREKLELERQIRTTLDKLVKLHKMESVLQDRYVTNREGRWVLPVRSGMQHNFDGIIHDSSQSKQTVFMEPQVVVKLNNDLRRVNMEIEAEIERLLKQLSQFLASIADEFESSFSILAIVDVRLAEAQLSHAIAAKAPRFDSVVFNLKSLRHPLLALQKPDGVVANSVELGAQGKARILLLSGPNAGGKTVLLKAVGLAAQMARCGLPICADEDSTIPFFTNVHAVIGDAQSVDEALSTFAAHMQNLSRATQVQGAHGLILVDEICGSTDPEEGAALARAFVEHFAQNRVFGVITSHLGPLKHGWNQDMVLQGSMDYDDLRQRPTYQLLTGIAGRSLAIRMAKDAGVAPLIINRAFELLSPEVRERARALEDVEHVRQEIVKLKDELGKESLRVQEKRAHYASLIERFKKDRDIWMNKAIEQGKAKIDRVVTDLREKNLNKKTPEDIKYELPQIVKSQPRQTPQSAEDFGRAFPPGTAVFVPSLGQEGIIQSLPSSRGEVEILSHLMRVSLPWQQVQPSRAGNVPNREILRRSGFAQFSIPKEDRTVDVRGKRVEDAIDLLELQLDRAVQAQEDRVKIIHGHGTEALKKAIRSYLSRSVYVQRWQAGNASDDSTHGINDGLTLVELSDPAENR